MYWRRVGDSIAFSRDGDEEHFRCDADAFADISYAAAWPRSGPIILTAARGESDRANVRLNQKGNYRAYRVSEVGIEQLTDEYTNTAIPLPDGIGLAYSNGSSLVLVRDGQRRSFKVGTFNWGPVSLSCDYTGQRVAMTKWKGDHRKVAYVDPAMTSIAVSRFSCYSYLLFSDQILYETLHDVLSYSPSSNKSRSVFTRSERRKLLDLLGVGAERIDETLVRFGQLSLFKGAAVAGARVQDSSSYDCIWSGLIKLPQDGQPLEVVHTVDSHWGIAAVLSAGDELQLALERYENTQLVEARTAVVGGDGRDPDWQLINTPRVPAAGFQFLP